MLYTSVLLRVLVGKGYGVRASEYGLAPPTIQVRNIRTGNILFRNPIFCLHRRYKNDNGCRDPAVGASLPGFPALVVPVFLQRSVTGRASVAEVLRPILGCCTGVNH